MELYLQAAYPPPQGVPAGLAPRVDAVRGLDPASDVPLDTLLERDPANTLPSFALRLGQPMYPYMKLVVDEAPPIAPPIPGSPSAAMADTGDFILRVDSHDRHLHAPAGSPDAAWLASVRASNKELGERIEAAWAEAGLPTFKTYLRRRLQERKSRGNAPAST
jgi:hypothetical protein